MEHPPVTQTSRSGCLKWTCGCLAAVVVVSIACCVLGWYLLTRWEPGLSAWEHMPPSTAWAAEAYDINSLLDKGLADPGMRELLRRGAELLDASGRAGSPRAVGEKTIAAQADDVIAVYRFLSFAYRAAAPNTALIGGGAHSLFAVARPPPWLKLLFSDDGAMVYSEDAELYCAMRDGWLILSAEFMQVEEVLAHWDSRAKPFGSAPKAEDPYVAVGVRRGEALGGAVAPQPTDPGMLVFGDPFAEPAVDAGASMVAVLRPMNGGWRFSAMAGNVADAAEERASEALPEVLPSAVAAGKNIELAVRLSDGAHEKFRERLLELAAFPEDLPHRFALGKRWLHDLWLGRLGNGATLLLGEPTVGSEAFAALPGTAFGWEWRGGGANAGEFIDGLTLWLDAAGAPGGDMLADAARSVVRYRKIETDGGAAIRLEPPEPLFSGARPTWLAEEGRLGWFGSDMAAIPDRGGEGDLLLGILPRPGEGMARSVGVWNVSPLFLEKAGAFLQERWAAMPGEWRQGHATLAVVAALSSRFLAAYPRGAAAALVDMEGETALVRGTVRSK